MKYLVAGLIALLIVLHQDFWQHADAALLFGFLPKTLAYHSAISIAAAVVWLLAVQFCWPQRVRAVDLHHPDVIKPGPASGEQGASE